MRDNVLRGLAALVVLIGSICVAIVNAGMVAR